jgi:cytoskeleton protein RodZ
MNEASEEQGRRRPAPMSPGEQLRAARERAGWRAETLAAELCLPLERLRALERDEHASFGGAVFVRGYLRRAALLLGLSPQELLGAYEACCEAARPTEVLPSLPPGRIPSSGAPAWGGRLAGGAAIVAAVASTWWIMGPSDEEARTVDATASRAPAALEFTAAEETLVDRAPPSPQLMPALRELEPVAEEASAAVEAPQLPVAHLPETSLVEVQETALPRPGTVELRLEFSEDCWLEVTDAEDRRLAYRLHRAGDVVRLRGTAPVSLFLGNAEGVRLTMDGTAVPLRPARRDGTARLTLGGGAG